MRCLVRTWRVCRRLEDVLTAKQAQLLELIRQAKEQADAEDAAVAAARGGTAPAAAAAGEGLNGRRRVKRSPSVAWSSPTMHASSDGWDAEVQLKAESQDQQQVQQQVELHDDTNYHSPNKTASSRKGVAAARAAISGSVAEPQMVCGSNATAGTPDFIAEGSSSVNAAGTCQHPASL